MSGFREFGVVLPTLALFGGEPAGHRGLIDYAKAAHSLGFQSAWAADHIMHEVPGHYATACLQAVATAVPEMKIGFGTMPAFVRHPLAAAKIIFTLQTLSEGRLEVALSIGDEREEMAALGVERRERGGRLDETLDILSRLAAGDEISHEGRYYSFERARILPAPPGGKLPPLFIASWTGKKALERILRYDAGWMASGLFSREDGLRAGMETVREAAAERGKQSPPAIITNVPVAISDDRSALEDVRMFLGGPQPLMDDEAGLRLVGPAELAKERLSRIESIGFERLNVLPARYDLWQLEAFMKLVS
jgi:alkanesulfonate monooxygenase SsuD/methylene tetrahydromethanopterin reductase-like flavin-dependent oxidoreductase (luciferase family)